MQEYVESYKNVLEIKPQKNYINSTIYSKKTKRKQWKQDTKKNTKFNMPTQIEN